MFKNILFCVNLFLLIRGALMIHSCEKHRTCHDCIRDVNNCTWCGSTKINGTRCNPQNTNTTTEWCPEPLENPKSFLDPNIPEDRPFSSARDNVVQIKPQRYKLKLRPGQPINLPFSFQVAEDYPVDMYFLLDTSGSMEKINRMAADQAKTIYLTMQTMTKDVNLGFGTFIDKNAFPFTDKINSTETYSFRHRLKLTKDIETFEETIKRTPSGYNRDLPEGGLDALAQAMVCKDVVGWRDQSTKIVIFVTDASYHVAGDGKNAGIFEPFDGQCHTENDTYIKELKMDYPSIGMIKKIAARNEVIVIFFVDDEVQSVYHDLSKAVSGWKYQTFDKNSEDINDLSELFVLTLKEIYEKITKQIKLKYNVRTGLKKNIRLNFNPDCSQDKCNVKNKEPTNFMVNVELLEYDGNNNLTIDIGVEGIIEKLTLDVEVIKDCDCEKKEQRTDYCHKEIEECGICKCGEKRYGDRCACIMNSKNTFNDISTCTAEGSKEVCSGVGSCICGTCKCRHGFNGEYCQCNDNSCDLGPNGELCNGKGECHCGTCKCKEPWDGKACQCIKSVKDCTDSDGTICNGRGKCDCNKCNCPHIASWDARNTQDDFCKVAPCNDCVSLQCDYLRDCALCEMNYVDDCSRCDNAIERNVTESLDSYLNSTEWNNCPEVRVDVGCHTQYVFKYKNNVYGISMVIRKKMDCTKSYYMYGGILLLCFILVGIGTLIGWKLITEARYKKEHDRFLEAHKDILDGVCDNPLYQSPKTHIANPTFRKRSFRRKISTD